MNNTLKAILTIYLVVVTIAAVAFGYLYFKNKTNEPAQLTIQEVENVIKDARATIEAGYTPPAQANSVNGGNYVSAASDSYDVYSYFATATEQTVDATKYSNLASTMESYLLMAQYHLYVGTSWNTLYKSTADGIDEGYTDTVFYKSTRTGEKQATIQSYMITTRDADSTITSAISIEWVVTKDVDNYDYIIKGEVAVDKADTGTGASSQICYMNFAKKNNATQFDYAIGVESHFNHNLETTLTENTTTSNLGYGAGIYFNFATNKEKVLSTSVTITALNGLKPYLQTNEALNSTSATENNFYNLYRQAVQDAQ